MREEHEILREKYMDILHRLNELYNDGKLMLNQRNIEKIDLYLQNINVLRAAGIDPEEERAAYLEKNAKLFKRKYHKNSVVTESNLTELNQDSYYINNTLYQDQNMFEADLFEEKD